MLNDSIWIETNRHWLLQSGTYCTKQLYNFRNKTVSPKDRTHRFLWRGDGGGGGRGGSPSDFLGSEILAESDCFGSMKDAGIYLGRKKKQRDFLGSKRGLRDFLG